MELKDFIKATLLDVLTAIHESQLEWISGINKGAINPAWDGTDQLSKHVQTVEFDVAVTAGSTKSGTAKAGINVFSMELGAGGDIKVENSTASRIKFSIPIVPPVQVIHGGNKLDQQPPVDTRRA